MWTWSEELDEWIDEQGETVPLLALLDFLWERIRLGSVHTAALTPLAMASRSLWYREMLKVITREYIIQYLLGRGGVGQMTEADWNLLRDLIDEQGEYLRGFANDLDQLSEAQITARGKLYIRSSQQAFWHGRVAARPDAEEVRWVMHPLAEHCPDCIAWDAIGWQEIETNPYGGCVPGSGCTQCLTNCRCHLEFK